MQQLAYEPEDRLVRLPLDAAVAPVEHPLVDRRRQRDEPGAVRRVLRQAAVHEGEEGLVCTVVVVVVVVVGVIVVVIVVVTAEKLGAACLEGPAEGPERRPVHRHAHRGPEHGVERRAVEQEVQHLLGGGGK